MVVMASITTLIASQAVISGAFSLARSAGLLGLLPHLRVVHTSEKEAGHIYLPAVNMLLYVAVAAVVLIFRSSESLSGAYGLAVTTDFLLTTSLLIILTRSGGPDAHARLAEGQRRRTRSAYRAGGLAEGVPCSLRGRGSSHDADRWFLLSLDDLDDAVPVACTWRDQPGCAVGRDARAPRVRLDGPARSYSRSS